MIKINKIFSSPARASKFTPGSPEGDTYIGLNLLLRAIYSLRYSRRDSVLKRRTPPNPSRGTRGV
jgi:hypothetical protein